MGRGAISRSTSRACAPRARTTDTRPRARSARSAPATRSRSASASTTTSTWCARLAQLEPRLETVNLGQGGYGLDQSYLWVRRDSAAFHPKLLVFAFTRDEFGRMEDDSYHHYAKPLLRLTESGDLEVRNVPVPNSGGRVPWLVRNLSLFEQLRIVALARPAMRALRALRVRAHRGRARRTVGRRVRGAPADRRRSGRRARAALPAYLSRLRESRRALAQPDRARGAHARLASSTSSRSCTRCRAARSRACTSRSTVRTRGRAPFSEAGHDWVAQALRRHLRETAGARPTRGARAPRPTATFADREAHGESFDLLIRGGTLVDGTGAPGARGRRRHPRRPHRRARRACAAARPRTLDASGAVVAPGFVDIHTHYDAQVFWDRMLIDLALARRHERRDGQLRLRHRADAPRAPRPDPAHARERRGHVARRAARGRRQRLAVRELPASTSTRSRRAARAINVGALVGHTPVRLYVMGEEATEREATPDEIAPMRALVREALARRRARLRHLEVADARRLRGQARCRAAPRRSPRSRRSPAASARSATASCRPRSAAASSSTQLAEIAQRAPARPVSWTALLAGFLGPTGTAASSSDTRSSRREGVAVVPQVSCRPLVVEFQLKAPFPFESMSRVPAGVRGRSRGQEAHLRRPGVPRARSARARRGRRSTRASTRS